MNIYQKSIVNKNNSLQGNIIPGREIDMTRNHDGAATFKVDKWNQLNRLLLLGTEGNQYYTSEIDLTKQNTDNLDACIKEDGVRVVNTIVEISNAGRAPKNDSALYSLAKCFAIGDLDTRRAAKNAINKVARTGTHFFFLTDLVLKLRGNGRLVKAALRSYYLDKVPLELAKQITKYGSRYNWTHRDILRLVRPKADNVDMNEVLNYAVKGWNEGNGNEYLRAVEKAKTANEKDLLNLIWGHRLPMEVIPTSSRSANVYREIAKQSGYQWLIRNLGNLAKHNIIAAGNFDDVNNIVTRLTSENDIRKSRIHPINILLALMTYSSGKGMKGSGVWYVEPKIVNALNDAFLLSFGNVTPTNKRLLVGVDMSGSMNGGSVANIPNLNPKQAAVAMAMIFAATEPNVEFVGFDTRLFNLAINHRYGLENIVKSLNMFGGGTDCSLPVQYALSIRKEFDAIVIFTDNESNSLFRPHVSQLVNEYRNSYNKNCKLVSMDMVSYNHSVLDNRDPQSLMVSGLDSGSPVVISAFLNGEF